MTIQYAGDSLFSRRIRCRHFPKRHNDVGVCACRNRARDKRILEMWMVCHTQGRDFDLFAIQRRFIVSVAFSSGAEDLSKRC